MEARFYLEARTSDNNQTTTKRERPITYAKLAFAFSAIFLSALFPYVSFTVEATHLPPIQQQQQLLIQYLLYVAIAVAFEITATPTCWSMRRRKLD